MLQSLGFGRVEMWFVKTVYAFWKQVLQTLGFKRVQVTMCCGGQHFMTPVSDQTGPPSLNIRAAQGLICKLVLQIVKIPLPEAEF